MRRKKSSSLDAEIEEFERWCNNHSLQIEHDLLKTASEVINNDLGGDLQSLVIEIRPC